MKNVIYYRKIPFNPVQHKVSMGQEMNFPVPERIQARVVAQFQASSHIGQRFFCCFKVIQYIGRDLTVLLLEQQISNKPVQVLFRICCHHNFIIHT